MADGAADNILSIKVTVEEEFASYALSTRYLMAKKTKATENVERVT